jgi:dTDP-4-dehydrorhamnose 3,5-epimerase-like enzyme
MSERPRMIPGGLAVDDRGLLTFNNDFSLQGVKRYYLVSNHRAGLVRAWHGHRREAKYVTVVRGAALVAAVEIDDWDRPNAEARVERFVLSSMRPGIVFVPSGFANGFMSLTEEALLLFFSTSSLEESAGDDVRFPARYWEPWQVEER